MLDVKGSGGIGGSYGQYPSTPSCDLTGWKTDGLPGCNRKKRSLGEPRFTGRINLRPQRTCCRGALGSLFCVCGPMKFGLADIVEMIWIAALIGVALYVIFGFES